MRQKFTRCDPKQYFATFFNFKKWNESSCTALVNTTLGYPCHKNKIIMVFFCIQTAVLKQITLKNISSITECESSKHRERTRKKREKQRKEKSKGAPRCRRGKIFLRPQNLT